ncbi:MAG: CD225/dispanin family protein [Chitinophagaceae bacterium]
MDQNTQSPLLPAPPPKNWLAESILVTIFCCLPFGIVGIVNASQVNSKYASGDHEGAIRAANEAAKWTKIAFWVGLGILTLYLLAIFFFGATAFWVARKSGNYDY